MTLHLSVAISQSSKNFHPSTTRNSSTTLTEETCSIICRSSTYVSSNCTSHYDNQKLAAGREIAVGQQSVDLLVKSCRPICISTKSAMEITPSALLVRGVSIPSLSKVPALAYHSPDHRDTIREEVQTNPIYMLHLLSSERTE